ncbi:hypothetical protein MPSEU_000951100 [Mayamaea pseudoterrestris]|nr:hypothetical protein MPSEU_000951100 [Mayamaea pseudoterrestris]
MSVEQDLTSEPSTLLEKQEIEMMTEDAMEKLQVQSTENSTVEESSSSSEPTDTFDGDVNAQELHQDDLRIWFTSLSNQERLAALGIRDVTFLTAIGKLASWCKLQVPSNPEAVPYTSGVIDWEAMMDCEEFGVFSSTRSMSIDCEPSLELIESTNDAAPTADSDAYRIRNKSSDLVSDSATAINIDNEKAKAVLDHICIVFPSAFEVATERAEEKANDMVDRNRAGDRNSVPLLTFHPKLLESNTGDELMNALDEWSNRACQCPFLSNDSLEWLRSSQEKQMPLFAVMLARFMAAAAAHDSAMDDTIGDSPTARVRRMKSLVDYCQSTNVVPPTLMELKDCFLGPCPEKSFAEMPLKTLAFTPLSWLVQYSNSNASNFCKPDFTALNKGLEKLLTKSVAANKGDTSKAAGQSLASQSLSNGTQSASAKKKKKTKKKNRQKNRSLSNADSIGSKVAAPSGGSNLQAAFDESLFDDEPAPRTPPKQARQKQVSSSNKREAAPEPIRKDIVSTPSLSSNTSAVSKDPAGLSQGGEDYDNSRVSRVVEESIAIKDVAVKVFVNASAEAATVKSESADAGPNGDVDDVTWETVETKTRASKKKPVTFGHVASTNYNGHRNAHHYSGGDQWAPKSPHRSGAQKKAKAGRRAVRDILGSLLDGVDDEVRRRASQQASRKVFASNPGVNAWKCGPLPSKLSVSSATRAPGVAARVEEAKNAPPTSLRDVVLGRHKTLATPGKTWAKAAIAQVPTKQPISAVASLTQRHEGQKPPIAWKTEKLQPGPQIQNKNFLNATKTTSADQNTAPTYQETLSASSLANAAMKCSPTGTEGRGSKSEISSGNTEEAAFCQKPVDKPKSTGKKAEDVPPLPVLLNHDNANSANSSVASSLEAPHALRHHHHSAVPDVNDVGYHLLDVCDKLSRDMSLFMSRRASSLNVRRQERGAVLAALQETVASIWPGTGHAQMYGSCATQTDLPSSDIDVVVVGLEFTAETMAGIKISPELPHAVSRNEVSAFASPDEMLKDDTRHIAVPPLPHQMPVTGFTPLQMQRMMNAERVRRLAAKLEKQSWAVKVNAIPTASVPVVKILADPSKLAGGLFNKGEGAIHSSPAISDSGSVTSHQSAGSTQLAHKHHFNPPWRGADIMNGLLSLDITFEGAGHGGIGSTQFSAQVIADACQEIGAHPDETVIVQTMMVIKELLAQRKLNEPYSGGLSSYAVLLLVLALLQERAVIREEIDRAERQRRAMSSDVRNSFAPVKDVDATPKAGPAKSPRYAPIPDRKKGKGQLKNNQVNRQTGSSTSSISSWASIAKKPNATEIVPNKQLGKKSEAQATNYTATASQSFSKTKAGSISTVAGATKVFDKSRPVFHASPLIKAENEVNDITDSSEVQPLAAPFIYPQGYNDIIEVLCSGRTTAGKLLMHFLLYYGQHFDAHTTAIDVSGKHERDYSLSPYTYFSPYITRRSAGTIDPVTGMLTVDPIVVYDPLEGAENSNVAKRCFAWSSVRWIFAQSYATLSSAVERSATPPASPASAITKMSASLDLVGDSTDPSSPLLSCLLSF